MTVENGDIESEKYGYLCDVCCCAKVGGGQCLRAFVMDVLIYGNI